MGFIFRGLKSQKKQPDVDFLGHENTISKKIDLLSYNVLHVLLKWAILICRYLQ